MVSVIAGQLCPPCHAPGKGQFLASLLIPSVILWSIRIAIIGKVGVIFGLFGNLVTSFNIKETP